jgi:hypothetical protein
LLIGTFLAVTGAAQTRGSAVNARGPNWLPRAMIGRGSGLTAAEQSVVEARLAEYERLFAVPESLVRPQGFQARPSAHGGVNDGQFGVARFNYELVLVDGVLKPGEPDYRERSPALWVHENVDARAVWIGDSGPPDFKDGNAGIFRERPRSGLLAGMPRNAVVFDGLKFDRATQARENVARVLLTSDGELPWADVSRERVLKIQIAQAQTVFKQVEQDAAETGYQKWLRDAPARQRQREEILAGVASVDKTQVAKVREDSERVERQTGDSLKKAEAAEREQSARNLALAKGRLTQLNAELAAMSPAERAMAAWIQPTNQGTFKFAAPGTTGFHHLIVDKPDYYRFKGSRVQVRSLLIGFRVRDAQGAPGEQEDRAVADSFKAFDWAAAARLLTPSAK